MRRSYLGKLLLLLSAGVAVLTFQAVAQDIQVVTYTNTVWVYNDSSTAANNPNLDPAHSWRFPDFVPVIGNGENEWKTGGRGLFGNDTSTVYTNAFGTAGNGFRTPVNRSTSVPPGTDSLRITFYFITKFNWPHDPTGVILRGTNYLDDGAIVYLNGIEVFRARMGTPFTEQAWSDLAVNQGAEGVPEPLEYNATSLVQGENTLAIELHQSGTASSDLAFATALRAVIPFAPVIFTPNEPADRSVIQNRSTTFAVTGDGSPRPTYQWYKDNAPIDGATNTSYTIALMQPADAGLYKVILNNEFGSVSSREANVTYIADATAPAPISVIQNGAFNSLLVTFDELVEEVSAINQFTYGVNDGVNGQIDPTTVTLNPDGKSVTIDYGVFNLLPATQYTIHIADVSDLAGNAMTAEVTLPFTTWVPSTACGGVLFEAFDTQDATDVTAISALTGHPSFPNNPTEHFRINSFSSKEAYPDDSHNRFGARMRALFIPPTSGNWVFYLSSDDASQLFLNPNGPGANGKILVQEEAACCNPYTSHATATYALNAGSAYYLEALYKEGGGGDNCHVWAGLQGAVPPSAANAALTAADAIPGSMLGSVAAPLNVAGTFTITQQPASQFAVPNTPITFSVGTSTDTLLCYQWLRDGVPIPNAVHPQYKLTASPSDNGAVFTVEISILGGNSVTSAGATLTVGADTVRPTVLSVVANAAGSALTVTYSEAMGPSAAVAANYTVNGVAAGSATATSPTVITVVPATPLPGGGCTIVPVRISGVSDAAETPNLINPNPTVVSISSPFVEILALDAMWKFNDSGTDLGTTWSATAFNDTAWSSGPAPLGFEPGVPQVPAVATAIAAGSATNTTYFRTHFNLGVNPNTIAVLQLGEITDDGAVYYLNGVEVRRTRMPDAPAAITFATLATAGGPEPADGTHPVEYSSIPKTALVTGDNVLAVELHSSSLTSSDSEFAATLKLVFCLPTLVVEHVGSQIKLTWSDASYRLEKAADVTGPWSSQAGSSGLLLPATPNNAFFRLVSP